MTVLQPFDYFKAQQLALIEQLTNNLDYNEEDPHHRIKLPRSSVRSL